MALLDQLFASLATPPGFDALDAAGMRQPGTPEAEAELARLAAAERLKRGVKRPPAPFGPEEGVPFINAVAGLLSPGGAAAAPAMPAAAPAPDLPPSTNDPDAREPTLFQDGVPIPRPRPGDLGAADPTRTPEEPTGEPVTGRAPLSLAPGAPGALTAPGTAPGGLPAAIAPSGGGIMGKLFNPANAATMLALGSGFAGAPSIGTGMRRAFGAATAPAALLRKEQVAQGSQAETYRALVGRGVPPQEALAATLNPEVMKATVAKYFETKPSVPHEIGTDMLGNKIMGSFDPNTKKYYDAAGREIGGPGATSNAGAMPTAGAGLLAKGVETYNPELIGDDYLNQFSPDVKAAIRSYMRGDTHPTGNPRLKGFETKVKEWARRYGETIGVPVSDALFAERRKYRTELGSNSATTAGGQAKAFNQAVEHGDALATTLEKLGNYDPVGIPQVSRGINWARQEFNTKQKGLAARVAALGQTLAGEVGKLFSGAAGGGVHERELTRKRFDTIASPAELAGALEGTLETMEGGLRALEQRRDQILGPNSGVNFVSPETHEKIARIKQVIARLRGDDTAAPAPTIPKPTAPITSDTTRTGIKWSVQ